MVGLLVDRAGFPLEIGCWEGNKAEKYTILPIVEQFQARHGLADLVVVADAGMLSAANLNDLDKAQLRFIVGSRVTKAPKDLASHFRWHGDAFTDGQLIDTITPKGRKASENNVKVRAEPAWDPEKHPGSWRAVWAYSAKRAARDAIEAHLTIVFTALAVSREIQARTGLSIRNVIRQLRPLRSATLAINGVTQSFPPQIPAEQQAILDAINTSEITH